MKKAKILYVLSILLFALTVISGVVALMAVLLNWNQLIAIIGLIILFFSIVLGMLFEFISDKMLDKEKETEKELRKHK